MCRKRCPDMKSSMTMPYFKYTAHLRLHFERLGPEEGLKAGDAGQQGGTEVKVRKIDRYRNID